MKKALKYVLLSILVLLMIVGVVSAICWVTDTAVTFMEIIKAVIIGACSVCVIAIGFTLIMTLIENLED